MEERQLSSGCRLCISYLEVYNEAIRDLLDVEGAPPLTLRESDTSGCQVVGLSKHFPSSDKEMYGLIQRGNSSRSQAPTDTNAQVSVACPKDTPPLCTVQWVS